MEHRAHRRRRTPHHPRDLLKGVGRDQVQQFLLFWFGPWSIAALGFDSRLPDKPPASPSWISRGRSYPRDKCLQSDRHGWSIACRPRRVQIRCYDFSCSVRPAKCTTLYGSIQLIHVAAGLWKTNPTSPPTYTWLQNKNVSRRKQHFCRLAARTVAVPKDFRRQRSGIVGFCWRRDGRESVSIQCTFMDSEKDLIDAFENLVHRDFPNPERVGCPGREVLAQLARLPSDIEPSQLLAHVRKCAPCFDELKDLRKSRASIEVNSKPGDTRSQG
jgi:hypothetical protein